MGNYVRNAWYVVGWSQDLAPAKPLAITIIDERIMLYRKVDGSPVALQDRCVHRLAPLSLGRCEGDRVRCMYHGILYDSDGRVVEIPGQEIIPQQARVRRFPVVERHSWIWVWAGEEAKADARLIPAASAFDDPAFILGRGHLDYASEARLINDNLLDFSHLTYVHAESFGAGDTWAKSHPKVTPIARGVRFERWLSAEPGPRTQATAPMDRWQSYDFLVPGILLMVGGNYPVGTAEKCRGGPPDLADAVSGVTFTGQAVTPTGPKTSRYFFSWGPRRDHGDEAHRDMLMGIAARAFAEDKAMIEAQQLVLDASPGARVMPTAADKGLTLFHNLTEKLRREEASVNVA